MQWCYFVSIELLAKSLSYKSIREAIDYLWQGGPRAWLELIVGTALVIAVGFGLARLVRWIVNDDPY